jgi:hypothetical protein
MPRIPLTTEQLAERRAAQKARKQRLKEDIAKEEGEIWNKLMSEIFYRQKELGIGDYTLAAHIGCKWDTVRGFHKGLSMPSAVRVLLMIKKLGGHVHIDWLPASSMPELDRRKSPRGQG